MMQNYQIFLNQKSLTFIKSKDSLSLEALSNVKLFEISELSDINLLSFFNEKTIYNWVLICGEKIDSLFSEFKKDFKVIYAAGGLVESSEKDILFIYRNGVWDLPKGKVEKGEDFKDAAIREVKEECGLKSLTIEKRLTETYHIYKLNKEYILKETHWYKMSAEKGQKLVPQVEEGIIKVEWITEKKLSSILQNTYPNIQLLTEKFQ